MNKRIKELAEQAGYTPLPGFDFANELQEVFLKKFAELIVKECAYLVNHQQRTTGYTTHARMLCEEFGVEFREEDYFGVKE